jgi:hypothetical protein
MRRSLLSLVGLLVVVGCGDTATRRTVFVEVVSLPSGLLMSISVGFADPVEFEAQTPIARNVRARVFCTAGVGPSPEGCEIVASARVKGADPTGKRVTMCLTDAGEHDCATSNDGQVSVTMTVRPE